MTQQMELPEGVTWEEKTTHTARGLPRTEIVITHKDLNAIHVIRDVSYFVAASKAAAWIQSWDQQWHTQKFILSAEATAEQRTEQAQAALRKLQSILHEGVRPSCRVEWSELESSFTESKPSRPILQGQPERPTKPEEAGEEPLESKDRYQPELGASFLDVFIPSRWRKRKEEAWQRFEHDHSKWEKAVEALERYTVLLEEWEKWIRQENERLLPKWKNDVATWENRKKQHEKDEKARVSSFKEAVTSGERAAIEDFFSIVLERSDYPDYFPHEFTIAYNRETKILVCDYQLPSPGALPTLREVAYVKTRKALAEKHLSKKDSQALYDSVAYQICLRTTYELFAADQFGVLDLVTFNGWVKEVDRGTGRDINPCILSLQATRKALEEIDLSRVEPKACFKTLKGVGSTKLHALAPVAPLLQLDTEDNRFVEGRSIANGLAEGTNLAAMDWEDFEHLIRELFEAEFAERDAVVKITQASRDRGVDAVVFDPDPIRGGKIILQAKRYTNTVGADAVRDLYGTVVKEGANKGILITTSDFGPDSYEYVKGLPITLLSGGNLVHLLGKHGHKARIDLVEAKQIQAEKDAEARR